MHWDLPIFKRCCFCIPLRYGLLALGYLKLAISIYLTAVIIYVIILAMDIFSNKAEWYRIVPLNVAIVFIAFLVGITDVIYNITFIVGGHKKNTRLMKKFYFYSIFIWVLLIGYLVYSFVDSLIYMNEVIEKYSLKTFLYYDLMESFYALVLVVIQGYIILLVRSEIFKLDGKCQFNFVNNAAEARCTLDVEEEKDSKQKKEVNKSDKEEI